MRHILVDASFIFPEGFSLGRILKLADLRAKDICCFSQLEKVRLTESALAKVQPVKLDTYCTCPKFSLASEETSHFCSVPLYILSSKTATQLARLSPAKGLELGFGMLLSTEPGNCILGLQVPTPWSAEVWHSRVTVLDQNSVETAAAASVPQRFKEADKWDYSAVKKMHPVYTTSSQQIGLKKPCQHDMQASWAGIKGGLAEFGPSKRTTSGLKTAVRTSKVHQSMDGWC